MSSPNLFLELNTIDNRWKVIDENGLAFGDGLTKREAIESARIVTDEPISFGACHEIPNMIVTNTDKVLFNHEEIIESLADLGGMKVTKIYDDEFGLLGYSMELKQ